MAPLVEIRTGLSGPGPGFGIVRGGVRRDGDQLQALDVEHGRQEVVELALATFLVGGIFDVLGKMTTLSDFYPTTRTLLNLLKLSLSPYPLLLLSLTICRTAGSLRSMEIAGIEPTSLRSESDHSNHKATIIAVQQCLKLNLRGDMFLDN